MDITNLKLSCYILTTWGQQKQAVEFYVNLIFFSLVAKCSCHVHQLDTNCLSLPLGAVQVCFFSQLKTAQITQSEPKQ